MIVKRVGCDHSIHRHPHLRCPERHPEACSSPSTFGCTPAVTVCSAYAVLRHMAVLPDLEVLTAVTVISADAVLRHELGLEVMNFFSCSFQLSMKFKMLINTDIAKINGIFRFKS